MPPQKRWQSVRPWLPPVSTQSDPSTSSPIDSPTLCSPQVNNKLRLQVLDVTATAVALSVTTPPGHYSSSHRSDSPERGNLDSINSKPPAISIQLDRRPWPHVAHAASSSSENLTSNQQHASETTVIVYGLNPATDYEISLELISNEEGEENLHSNSMIEIETEQADSSLQEITATSIQTQPQPIPAPTITATTSTPPETTTSSPSTSNHVPAPEGPPPPYSPTLPPSPPNEPQLRATLKKIRASSKRTESVLNASISALKKSVEKGMKEDQRARTRIVGLEDAIRKAGEGEREMRGNELELCEDRIQELEAEEEEVKILLEKRKEGKISTSTPSPSRAPVVDIDTVPEAPAEEERDDEDLVQEGISELSRELEGLNKAIEEIENSARRKAKESIENLESELKTIDAEMAQIDREETHRYHMALRARMSNDSLDRVDPARAPLPASASASQPGGGFNLRWRRSTSNPTAASNPPPVPAVIPPPAATDPKSISRFFRRQNANSSPNVVDQTNLPLVEGISSPTEELIMPAGVSDRLIAQQQFAQAHQAMSLNRINANVTNSTSPTLSPPIQPPSTNSVRSFGGALRKRRSNSAAISPSFPPMTEESEANLGAMDSLPIPIPKKEGKDNKETSSASSASTLGASWNKIGTWSQVVTRTGKDKEKEKEKEKAATGSED